MQPNGREGIGKQTHVLHDEGIDPDMIQIVNERHGCGILVVVEQGIERDKHLHTVEMGVGNELTERIERIGSRLTRTETRRTDIDRIGARLNGGTSHLGITRRREEGQTMGKRRV